MTAHALVAGTLFRTPERKVSRNGRGYVSATVKCRDDEGAQFWRVMVFSESAGEEMMRLVDGDAVSVQGAMRAELYRPEGGEPRLSLSIVADHVLALRQPAKKREKRPADASSGSARHHRAWERAKTRERAFIAVCATWRAPGRSRAQRRHSFLKRRRDGPISRKPQKA